MACLSGPFLPVLSRPRSLLLWMLVSPVSALQSGCLCFPNLFPVRLSVFSAGGARASRVSRSLQRGLGPRNLPAWARAEEDPPCLQNTFVPGRACLGPLRRGRETKGLGVAVDSLWQKSASMSGMRPPAGSRGGSFKTFHKRVLSAHPALTEASFVCPEHIVFIFSEELTPHLSPPTAGSGREVHGACLRVCIPVSHGGEDSPYTWLPKHRW